jgi:hypothetical protein
MPGFCGKCGAPLGGQAGFCGGCGARAVSAPMSQPPVPGPAPVVAQSPARSSGSTVKLILIAVGVLFMLGVIGIGGVYYSARRYVKMAEEVTGLKSGDVVRSLSEAAKRTSQGAREPKRDGCLLLSKEEASAILGIQVERVDGKPSEQQSGEHCDFFVKPGSVDENLEKLKESAKAANADPNAETKPNELPQGAIDMNKVLARGVIEAARNGEAPYFGFAVERENAKIAFQAFKLADRLGGGDLASGGKAGEPLGVGDQSAIGMGESRICVLHGSSAVTLDLTQVTDGRTKGIALAKAILSRL